MFARDDWDGQHCWSCWKVVFVLVKCASGQTGAPESFCLTVVMPLVAGERAKKVALLFLVVRPGAPSSILAPSSDALCSQ